MTQPITEAGMEAIARKALLAGTDSFTIADAGKELRCHSASVRNWFDGHRRKDHIAALCKALGLTDVKVDRTSGRMVIVLVREGTDPIVAVPG